MTDRKDSGGISLGEVLLAVVLVALILTLAGCTAAPPLSRNALSGAAVPAVSDSSLAAGALDADGTTRHGAAVLPVSAASPQGSFTSADSVVLAIRLKDGSQAPGGTAWVYAADSVSIERNTLLRTAGPEAFRLGLDATEATVAPGDTAYVRVRRGPTFCTAFAFHATNQAMGREKDGGRQYATPIVPLNWYGDTSLDGDTVSVTVAFDPIPTRTPCFQTGGECP